MRRRMSLRTDLRQLRRQPHLRDDDGNAVVEFIVLAVVLLIPSLYLVLTLGSVQSAVFAADVIARDSARIHAAVADPTEAAAQSAAHTTMVLEDYGLHTDADVVDISCSLDPCAAPGGTVRAVVRIPVPVPGLGPVLGKAGPVTVGSDHVVRVDRHRGLAP